MLAEARARSSPSSLQKAFASALVSLAGLPSLPMPQPLLSRPAFCLKTFLSNDLEGDLPTLGHLLSTLFPLCRKSPPVEEGLDLHLPYQKHIWKLASIKTVCAWRLPSTTALDPWTSMRLKKDIDFDAENKYSMPWQINLCDMISVNP